MDKQSRPEHSERCETLSIRKKCYSCYRITKNNYSKGCIKVKKKPAVPAPRPEHSDMCPTLSIRKKCYTCFRSYVNLNDPRKKVSKIQTRNKTKFITKYDKVVCQKCEHKSFNDLCSKCISKYNSEKQKNYRINKRQKNIHEATKENMLVGDALSTVQPINDLNLGLVQTANTCQDITNKLENRQAESNQIQSNDIPSVLKPVKYNCKQNNHATLPLNENSTASMKKKSHVKRIRKQKSSEKKEKLLSDKTLRNAACQINKISGSSDSKIQKLSYAINKSTEYEFQAIMKNVSPRSNMEMARKIHRENIRTFGKKSNTNYTALSNIIKYIDVKNPKDIENNFRVKNEKATELYIHKETSRKERKRKITFTVISRIHDFYKRPEITTVSPSYRSTSQKKGPSRHMRFSYMETFKLFRIENPDITISFMKFYTLRPKNIKPLRNTPMLGCLCVYCLNVKLKLIKLKKIVLII